MIPCDCQQAIGWAQQADSELQWMMGRWRDVCITVRIYHVAGDLMLLTKEFCENVEHGNTETLAQSTPVSHTRNSSDDYLFSTFPTYPVFVEAWTLSFPTSSL